MNIVILEFSRRIKKGVERDWVLISNRSTFSETGNPAVSTWHKVKSLRPPEMDEDEDVNEGKMMHMNAVWSVVGPAYEAWLAGNELPETGTALTSWAGATPDQVGILRKFGVKSVEDLAAMSEALRGKIPLPNTLDLIRQAKIWSEGKDTADMAAQIAELQQQNTAMMEMLADQPKPKRGRPRKTEPEAEAA